MKPCKRCNGEPCIHGPWANQPGAVRAIVSAVRPPPTPPYHYKQKVRENRSSESLPRVILKRNPSRWWVLMQMAYDHRCVACGSQAALTKDHVEPKSNGGRDHFTNIQPMCRPCNAAKDSLFVDYRTAEQIARFAQLLEQFPVLSYDRRYHPDSPLRLERNEWWRNRNLAREGIVDQASLKPVKLSGPIQTADALMRWYDPDTELPL